MPDSRRDELDGTPTNDRDRLIAGIREKYAIQVEVYLLVLGEMDDQTRGRLVEATFDKFEGGLYDPDEMHDNWRIHRDIPGRSKDKTCSLARSFRTIAESLQERYRYEGRPERRREAPDHDRKAQIEEAVARVNAEVRGWIKDRYGPDSVEGPPEMLGDSVDTLIHLVCAPVVAAADVFNTTPAKATGGVDVQALVDKLRSRCAEVFLSDAFREEARWQLRLDPAIRWLLPQVERLAVDRGRQHRPNRNYQLTDISDHFLAELLDDRGFLEQLVEAFEASRGSETLPPSICRLISNLLGKADWYVRMAADMRAAARPPRERVPQGEQDPGAPGGDFTGNAPNYAGRIDPAGQVGDARRSNGHSGRAAGSAPRPIDQEEDTHDESPDHHEALRVVFVHVSLQPPDDGFVWVLNQVKRVRQADIARAIERGNGEVGERIGRVMASLKDRFGGEMDR